MQNNIIKAIDFKPEMVKITEPKVNKKNKLIAAILNAETGSPLYIETAAMNCPFGLSSYEENYSVLLKDETSDPDSVDANKNLFASLKQVNTMGIDYIMKYSKEIMKKELNDSQRIIAETQFNQCVSQDKNGVDQLKLKIQRNLDDNYPEVLIFKSSPDKIDLTKEGSITPAESWDYLSSLIPRNVSVKSIMQPRIYFINGKTGINFRLFQILVPNVVRTSRPDTVFGFSSPPIEKPIVEQTKASEEDEDEDEVLTAEVVEEEEEEEEEEESSA